MIIEQGTEIAVTHRREKTAKALRRASSLLEEPGGESWPAKFNLSTLPEDIRFVKAASHVEKAIEGLMNTTLPILRSRIQELDIRLAEIGEVAQAEARLEMIRSSVERRKQGLPGLPEHVLAQSEKIVAELKQKYLPGQAVEIAYVAEEPPILVADRTESALVAPSQVPDVKTSPEPKAVQKKAAAEEGAGNDQLFIPEFETTIHNLPQNSKKREIVLAIRRLRASNKRDPELIEVANEIWPHLSEADAINNLGAQLVGLRKVLADQGYGIATVREKGPDGNTSRLHLGTLKEVIELTEQRRASKAQREAKKSKPREKREYPRPKDQVKVHSRPKVAVDRRNGKKR